MPIFDHHSSKFVIYTFKKLLLPNTIFLSTTWNAVKNTILQKGHILDSSNKVYGVCYLHISDFTVMIYEFIPLVRDPL